LQVPAAIVYRLQFRAGRLLPCELAGRPVRTFQSPVTRPDLYKIYVVKADGDAVVYVGYTRQPIANRLRSGFQAKGEHGYHGYAWRDLPEVELLIWCFDHQQMEAIEAIEAEIVYLIRKNTGQWPAAQTEIHFHCTTTEQRDVAQAIYSTAVGVAC